MNKQVMLFFLSPQCILFYVTIWYCPGKTPEILGWHYSFLLSEKRRIES